ncbi:MAG: DNA polymerase I, partial [Chloroflexi bacterium]|nr:DNA polymerase I [Chloroflexota bacterium]
MTANRPVFMVIDGHALVHRAYHALPPLTVSKTGELVNAVYGFASMLLKALADFKPQYCAIAFDPGGATFRHVQDVTYKAHRPRMGEDLSQQFRRVHEIVEALGVPSFVVSGYEADDVIGTLARRATEEGLNTVIVTGDLDALQLVSPSVSVFTHQGHLGDTILYDEQTVLERYGVRPSHVTDMKGLKGDTSDNIPGVPGIGEKTAARLVQQFGSIEGIYEHLHEVTPARLQEILRINEKAARHSKWMATIVTDLPLERDPSSCRLGAFRKERLVELFRELEFRSLLSKVPQPTEEPEPSIKAEAAPIETEYRIICKPAELESLVQALASSRRFVLDLETTSQNPMQAELVGLSFSLAPGKAMYVPVGHLQAGLEGQLPLQQVLSALKPVLTDERIEKMAHNGKYDMTVLASYGIPLANLSFDTMVAAYLLNDKALGLKDMAFNRMGIEMTPISELIGTGRNQRSMAEVDIPAVAQYACADADITGRLREILEPQLIVQDLWRLFADVEMPLVPVLVRLERNGVVLDAPYLHEMSRSLGEQLQRLETEIYDEVGHQFNINSTHQLGAILFEELRLPGKRRTKNGYSTDANVLDSLRGVHPIIELILEYRQLTKLKSTYIDALPALVNPRTGRLHTSFNQTATATGRLSSSDPNLQNIPIRSELGKKVRQAFVAGDRGQEMFLLGADYSQIELRVLAHLSQDPGMLQAFWNDEDIHAATAAQVFGVAQDQVTSDMRRVA